MTDLKAKKVFIVDNDLEIRKALHLLFRCHGFEVELYDNGLEFLEIFQPDNTGCIIADIRMPAMSGLELQACLNRRNVRTPIIFITGHASVAMAVHALKQGAFDFLEKPFSINQLLNRAQEAVHYSNRQNGIARQIDELRRRLTSLTCREQEVLRQIIEGRSNKYISLDLGVSILTIETHRKHIMAKMKARHLSELVRMVICLRSSQGVNLQILQIGETAGFERAAVFHGSSWNGGRWESGQGEQPVTVG